MFILPQMILVVLVAIAWWHVSAHNAWAAMLGGLAVILPTLFFSQFFLGQVHTNSPQKVLVAFYVGEFLKLVFSVTALLVLAKYRFPILPLISGFIGAHVGTWFTPFFKMKQRAIRP
jgi:F0F1-type ATP synthase assembly protein I